jgi:Tol biopolymer transport system component
MLAAGILAYRLLLAKKESPLPFQAATSPRKLTTHGKVGVAAISPDANYIAYSVIDSGRRSILMRQIATAVDRTIVEPTEAGYEGLTFSRDGNYLYYIKWDKDKENSNLYRVSVLGGDSTKLIERVDSYITQSPDGKRLAFVRNDQGQQESALIIADADGSDQKKLLTRKFSELIIQGDPAWSPDGKAIVTGVFYPDRHGLGPLGLAEVQVDAGSIKEITPRAWGGLDGIAWMEDGSGFLISAADQSTGWFFQIWFVSYPGGEARRVTNDPNNYMGISLSRDSRVLLTLQSDWLSNIWVAPEGDSSRATQITTGKYEGFGGIAWAKGGKIVYGTRDWDIWVMNEDGSQPRLLTIDEHNCRNPAVSPDGRTVFFDTWRPGGRGIWRMGIDGSDAKRMTAAISALDTWPCCSPDGKWVFYESFISGKREIWRVASDGGEPAPWAGKVSELPAFSPDGRYVAGVYDDNTAILNVVPSEGGEPEKTFVLPPGVDRQAKICWTPDGRALTYSITQGAVSNICL